jgi:hypothetical protein
MEIKSDQVSTKDTSDTFSAKDMASLYKKIAKVMQDTEAVAQKTGKNNEQNYTYAQDEDIVKHMRKAIADAGLVVLPQLEKMDVRDVETSRGVRKVTRIKVNFRLCDSDTGVYIERAFIGEGYDALDKGVYKAYTGAKKYFLINTFLLASSDDPENDGGSSTKYDNKKQTRPASARPSQSTTQQSKPAVGAGGMTESQQKMIFSLGVQKGYEAEEIKEIVKSWYKLESFTQLNKANNGKKVASAIIERVMKMDPKPEPEVKAGNEDVSPDEIPEDL